jgi:hypothetical protein
MKAGKHTAGSTGALLSLASWTDTRDEGTPRAAHPQPARAAAPQVSPLLSGLAKGHQEALRPEQAPAAGPTLFDLLKANAGKPVAPPQARPSPQKIEGRPPRAMTRTMPAVSRARWLAVPAGVIAGLAAGYLLAGAPLYDARAELILKPETVRGAAGAQPAPAERPQVTAAAVKHSMARLVSQEVLEPVVDKLQLAANPAFGAGDRAAAVAKLAASLSASPQSLTAGYAITARAGEATLAGDIANAVADSLVETHDPEGAGPPPTRLEVAFRAMPGVAGPEQTPLIPAGLGGLAGAALGLALAIAAGRRRTQGGALPLMPPSPSLQPSPPTPARRQLVMPRATAPISAHGIAPRRSAMPAGDTGPVVQADAGPAEPAMQAGEKPRPVPRRNFAAGLRKRLRPNPTMAGPAATEAPAAPNPTAKAATPAPAPAAPPSPSAPEPAMYPPHPLSPLAYPQQPAPLQAGWWPQPVGHPQPAPFAPAYPPAMAMPGYGPAVPYYPPAMPHFAAPASYFPAPQPQLQPYPVAVPVPYPVPVAMPAPAPVIQHEAPRQPQAVPAAAAAPAAEPADHTAETLSAIDEVRTQLRAFAGSLDALRAARSA